MRADNYEAVKQIARDKGGECLSKRYVGSADTLRWRCAEGHVFSTTPNMIRRGHWCSRCSGVAKLTIGKMRAAARRRGGACLSESYTSTSHPLRWRCSEGHEWSAPPNGVLYRNTWCPHCSGNFQEDPEVLLATSRKLAAERGGELLSKEVEAASYKVRWRCELGHAFAMSYFHAEYGQWCPRCRAAPEVDLETLRAMARRRGGECLSPKYLGSTRKHRWRCKSGHVWDAVASSVVGGHWCAVCSRKRGPRPVLDISDMQATAEARGGACLSEEYINSTTHLLWRCASGHEWEATGNSVRQGNWCPSCAHRYRGSTDGLRRLASDRGGELVSRLYENRKVPLIWACSKGHRFKLTSTAAKSGAWCPECNG